MRCFAVQEWREIAPSLRSNRFCQPFQFRCLQENTGKYAGPKLFAAKMLRSQMGLRHLMHFSSGTSSPYAYCDGIISHGSLLTARRFLKWTFAQVLVKVTCALNFVFHETLITCVLLNGEGLFILLSLLVTVIFFSSIFKKHLLKAVHISRNVLTSPRGFYRFPNFKVVWNYI